MKSGAIAFWGACVVFTLPAFAQSAPSNPNAQIEQCIRQNAPKVEAAIPDLKNGASFLVENICAVPVAAVTAKRVNAQMAANNALMQKMCAEEKSEKKDETAKNQGAVSYLCSAGRVGIVNTNQYLNDEDDQPYYSGQASPEMIALAASLLLDLRLAHQKSEAPH